MLAASKNLYNKYKSPLTSCELFADLEPDQWNEFLVFFHEEEWPKNTCLLNYQKFLFHFYIVISGRIKMYQADEFSEKEHTLFILSKGDVLDLILSTRW